ncbi:MAG: ribosome biogenesis GTPase Der [Elusimicrobiota bacterium]
METIVIVGRPNAGKSTLFNRLIGRRKALVHHEPGTTRDMNENVVTWGDMSFILADTGGWGDETSQFSAEIRENLEKALTQSDYALFVVDGKNGLNPLDLELAKFIRRLNKKTILVVNKIDSEREESKTFDFYKLGIDNIVNVSATHGRNIPELMEKISGLIPMDNKISAGEKTENAIKVILLGKPNVGKSSFLNMICKEERTIVSEKAGTTREAIDIVIRRGERTFVLVDTPGLRKKRKFKNDLEYLSSLSAHHAVENAEVAVLIIDATQGVGETEARIAELILENRCACLIAVNKWDLIESREEMVKRFNGLLEQKLKFLWWSKVVFMSAKTGQRTEKILDEVYGIYQEYSKTADSDRIKEVFENAFARNPFSQKGEMLKLTKVSQTGTRPPHFTLLVNKTELVHFSYRRYLTNILRENFGFTGTPIVLKFVRG